MQQQQQQQQVSLGLALRHRHHCSIISTITGRVLGTLHTSLHDLELGLGLGDLTCERHVSSP